MARKKKSRRKPAAPQKAKPEIEPQSSEEFEPLPAQHEINPDDVDSTYDDRDRNLEINPDDVDATHR